ncbi:MBG domain-containing protein [Paraflavitalea pollutisoli]|uniref:MBG domain-containing protein n=1 Tax=Paraflavitalea pollutisoli TaxID=3034143 RepID=UPI0023EC755A|nr:MBG domain-containing protein [Paraflavitalea sp. H1-2-19X]
MASLFAVCATSAHYATFSGKPPADKRAGAVSSHNGTQRNSTASEDLAITELVPEYKTFNRLWSGENKIFVTVTNNGSGDKTDIAVALTIAGANAESLTETIASLPAGESTTLTFLGSVTNSGSQQIEAALPFDANDEDHSNDSKQSAQEISCNKYGFTGTEPITTGFGFGSGTGIVSARYTAPTIPVYIKGVTVHLSDDPTNVGKSITGVLLDEVGNIIADSEPFYASSGDLNNEVTLTFYQPVLPEAGAVFFAGVRMDEADQSPVGVADPAITPANRYFTFAAEGGAATHYTTLGSLKIGILAGPGAELQRSEEGEIVAGTPVTFTATEGFETYTFMINGVAAQSGPENVYTYHPANNDNVYVEVHNNGCISDPIGNFVMAVKGINPVGNIIYVNKQNFNSGDGGTWATSVRELADALRYAKLREADWTSEHPLQIWVAGGTYKPLYSPADNLFGIADGSYNSFLLVKNVQVYGGFAGTESSLAERNRSLTINKSILSGDFNDNDVISGTGADLTINNTIDNACHIVVASGDVGSALLDGFTITGSGGNSEVLEDIIVNGEYVTRLGGGGIHNYMSSPAYSNLIIYGNRSMFYGGGIYNDQSSPVFTNLLVYNNFTDFQGGGIANTNMSQPVLTNLTITGNFAGVEAGGYININSNPLIRNTIVSGNSSPIYDDNSYPVVLYSLIEGMPEDVDNGNIDGALDPGFTNPAAGNYTLKPGSITINTGSFFYYMSGQSPDLTHITTDLAGKPRIGGSTPDLGAFETNSKDQVITAEDITLTYGDGDTTLTATASSGLPITYTLNNYDVADLYQDPIDEHKWHIRPKKAGAVTITASQPGDDTYDAAPSVDIQLLINRKELTVTADNKTMAFGEPIPEFTISYEGFVLNENVSSITKPTIKTTATTASVPGDYPIILQGGDAANYEMKLVHGLLTIEGATIHIQHQPEEQTVCAGTATSFVTEANTTIQIPVGYQWQQSSDSSNWTNISGATQAQLSTTADHDVYYRCALTAPGRITHTQVVKLRVKPVEKPVIDLPNILCLSDGRVKLTANLPGGVFSGPGVYGNTWFIDTLKPSLQSVQYTYVNPNGCSVTTSKAVNLSLCGEKTLVTSAKANPNPTTGRVTVKILLTDNTKQNVVVTNSFGQVVLQQSVQFRKGWNQVPLDLSRLGAGLYFISINGYGQSTPSVISVLKQ